MKNVYSETHGIGFKHILFQNKTFNLFSMYLRGRERSGVRRTQRELDRRVTPSTGSLPKSLQYQGLRKGTQPRSSVWVAGNQLL